MEPLAIACNRRYDRLEVEGAPDLTPGANTEQEA
jgi:hypothetical protein